MSILKSEFELDIYERIVPLGLTEETSKKVIDIVFWAMEKIADTGRQEEMRKRDEEREACAKICDDIHYAWKFDDTIDSASGPRECAEKIRSQP